MVTPDPSSSRHEGAPPSAKPARRSSWRVIWLLLAVAGIVAGTVAVFQARHQVRIEQGVTGSYEIEGRCSYMGGGRRRLLDYEWTCAGSFRPNGRDEARFARLNSYQSDEPRGPMTVMATGPDDDLVWLPADVSSARKWTWAAVSYGGTVVSVVLFVYFGHRRRRR